jgi:hypothetical protein
MYPLDFTNLKIVKYRRKSGLDDKDEAFRLLEKGYEQHSVAMPYLGVDVFWNGMRSDPRYADLLRRMGLPQ